MPYEFNWAVNHQRSGNNYGHQEQRKGDNTKGSYFVHLPDGRVQRVTYFVNGNSGFVAKVIFEGNPVFLKRPTHGY